MFGVGITLNIAKYFKNLRYSCGAIAVILSIYLKPVLYIFVILLHLAI